MHLGWKKTKIVACPWDLEILATFIGQTSFLKVRSQVYLLTFNPTCVWKPWTRDQSSFLTQVACVRRYWVCTSSGRLIPREYVSPVPLSAQEGLFYRGKKLHWATASVQRRTLSFQMPEHPLAASAAFPLLFGCFNMSCAKGKGKKQGFASSMEKAMCYKENADSWGHMWPQDLSETFHIGL